MFFSLISRQGRLELHFWNMHEYTPGPPLGCQRCGKTLNLCVYEKFLRLRFTIINTLKTCFKWYNEVRISFSVHYMTGFYRRWRKYKGKRLSQQNKRGRKKHIFRAFNKTICAACIPSHVCHKTPNLYFHCAKCELGETLHFGTSYVAIGQSIVRNLSFLCGFELYVN